ncbi:hypothetical protein PO124_18580 [Bacillus licheniformis]|nr:hypothetical protein [Bacillus licheniformis]
MALANMIAAMDMGITVFDSSCGGLGGCPYAPGATGNAATDDLIYMCAQMGIETGVDLSKLLSAAKWIEDKPEESCQAEICRRLNQRTVSLMKRRKTEWSPMFFIP